MNMAIGLVGRKCGMTRVFTEDGHSIPVTVIQVEPNRITQVKTIERDGYPAIQVTTGKRRANRVTQSLAGHFAKANTEAGVGLWEFRLTKDEVENYQVGSDIKVDIFQIGQIVDVKGTSKGKGFAGPVKRHHFATQDATHGNSLSHRAHGSTGQRQTPGRVYKGKKMAGHLGNVQRTIQNLKVVEVDLERNLLLIQGAVPGATNGIVIVNPGVKSKVQAGEKQ